MPTVQLGMAIRLDPAKITDGMPHKDMADAVHNKIIASIMNDLNQYTKGDGKRFINPRVRMRLDSRRIMFDLLGDLEDNDKALQWMNNNFNSATFRTNLSQAVYQQLICWARNQYDLTLFSDQKSIWNEKEK